MFSTIETSQKMTLLLILFVSLLSLSLSSAFEISHILGRHPELSTFSNYITQTQLAHDIDPLHTITILAMANSDMGPLSGKPIDQIKKMISAHLLLDYYDLPMLNNIKGNTITVRNLLHANINITVSSGGNVEFRSGANVVPVKLVRSVYAEPYTLSVMQISGPIIPCGVEETRRSLADAPQQSNHANAPQQGNQNEAPAPPPPPPPPPPPSPKNGQSHAPEQQQHSNTPPPSDSQDHHNAPQPSSNSDANNKSSPSPKGDSPSSTPSSGPTGDAPSLAPEDADSSADGEGKGKSSSAMMSHGHLQACWIGVVLASVVFSI